MPENSRPWGPLFQQFIRYLVVGGVAFVIDFGLLYLLTEHLHFHYMVSATLGFTAGLAVNYLLCLWWIFEDRRLDNRAHEFLIFCAIGIAGLMLNNLLMFVLTGLAGLYYLASKLASAGVILVFNFSLRRFVLFTRRAPDSAAGLSS